MATLIVTTHIFGVTSPFDRGDSNYAGAAFFSSPRRCNVDAVLASFAPYD